MRCWIPLRYCAAFLLMRVSVCCGATTQPANEAATQAGAVQTAEVPATEGWTITNFSVEKGKCYRISATGNWTGSDGQATGPEGICPDDLYNALGVQPETTKDQRDQFYLGQHPRGALIARVGGSKFSMLVGKGMTFLAYSSGTVAFRMNDTDVASARSGKVRVTFSEVQPKWVDKGGYTTIGARIDVSDFLHLTPDGPFWEWGGQWGRPGQQAGRFPTIINGIYCYDSWTTKKTSARLDIKELWNNDTSKIKLISFVSTNGNVSIERNSEKEFVLHFNKTEGLGAVAISAVLNVEGSTSPPADAVVLAETATAPTDANAIERPQFRNRAKPLMKTLTSISAMTVDAIGGEEIAGEVGDIISTVAPGTSDPPAAMEHASNDDIGKDMQTAFNEALRAVQIRYPRWSGGHINISFGDKYSHKDGGSAGTAFAVLMLSNLEGFAIDPKLAITGDITVDWKVRAVGGIIMKLQGAATDKRLYAAIPVDNETPFADMRLIHGDACLWNIQTFSIATLQDAVAIARTDRNDDLGKAIKLFEDLKPKLAANESLTLRKPETKKTLEQILTLAPNHLSAKYLLGLINHTAPTAISSTATIYSMRRIYAPYAVLLKGEKPVVNRETLPVATTISTRKQIAILRPIIDRKFQPLLASLGGFAEAMDEFATNPAQRAVLKERAAAFDAAEAKLDEDPQLIAKLLRDGY